jgi:hypothetical protein
MTQAMAAQDIAAWPRGMSVEVAARYLSVSVSTFRRAVGVDVPPVHITPGRIVWLREDLDRWLDARAGRVAASAEIDPWTT